MKKIYDHHIHLGYGNFRTKDRSDKYLGTPLDSAYNNLLEYTNSDIRTLRDGGDKKMLGFQLREEAAAMGITLRSSGRALVKKGCYGIHLGEPVSNMEELKKELDFLINQGVDCVKLVQSGLVDVTGGAQKEDRSFNEKELAYIRETTKSCGLSVMVHVNFPAAIRSVAEVGMDTVEHGYFMTEEVLAVMAENHVAWTPTFAPFANVLTYGTAIKGWDITVVSAVVERHKIMVKKAAALGIPILLGSDSGSSIVPHGRGSLDERNYLRALLGDGFF